MKNTQLYPFERNKYYYGMLLSVENFNAEQKYMNDKRRLVNRLVNGCGVVSGLSVVRINEQTISLESGMAIDSTGREIIVPNPVTKKLSMLKGYESAMSSGKNAYVYLCMEYSEGEKGRGYDLASDSGDTAHDKIRESYDLYLTSAEPEDDIDPVRSLYENSETVFSDDHVRIRHIIQKFANALSEIELRVEIETFTKQFVSFSYDIQLICMTCEGEDSSVLSVRFDEILNEKTGKYILVYKLNTNNVTDAEAVAAIDPSTFTISYDKQPSDGTISGCCSTFVISGDITDAMFRSYYERDMDTVLRTSLGSRLYLARIDLVNAGETAVIECIHNVPFSQYVINSALQNALLRTSCMGLPGDIINDRSTAAGGREPMKASDKDVASGICRIDLSDGSLKNKVFYSEEIIHGLGLGSVTIVLGIVSGNSTVYGDTEIFKDDAPPVKLAAKLDPSKGSFVIGALSTATIMNDFLEVKWTAIRDVDETMNEKNEMKILIKPSSLVLKPRESRYLDAVCSNMANKTVRWSVVPETGGNIDSNGLYSAPSTEGVYEVVAQSAVYPDVKASVMVVVRE